MRILDLFCGAGGAAAGYKLAFLDAEIVGVDINPQPNYPFTFVQGDAMTYPLDGFDLIHASPPCQDHSTLKTMHAGHGTGWMLGETVRRLRACGTPHVIENVVGTGGVMGRSVRLCGTSFGLGVRRHRLFRCSFPLLVPPCNHALQPEPIDVTGTGGASLSPRLDGKGGQSRKPKSLEEARAAMGIDWMTRRELSQAIPPAYTEFIGNAFAAAAVRVMGDTP